MRLRVAIPALYVAALSAVAVFADVRLVRVEHANASLATRRTQNDCFDRKASAQMGPLETKCDPISETIPDSNVTVTTEARCSSRLTRQGSDANVRSITFTADGFASASQSKTIGAAANGGAECLAEFELDSPTECTIVFSRTAEASGSNSVPDVSFAAARHSLIGAGQSRRSFEFDSEFGAHDNGAPTSFMLQPGRLFFEAFAGGQVSLNSLGGATSQASASLTVTLTFGPADAEIRWNEPNGGDYADAARWEPQIVPVHDSEHNDTAIFGLNTSQPIPINTSGATAGRWIVENSSIRTSGDATISGGSAAEPSLLINAGGNLEHTSGLLSSVNTVVSGTLVVNGGARILSNTLALVATDSATAPSFTLVGGSTPTRANLGDLRIERGSLTATGKVEIELDGPLTLGADDADPNAVATLTLGEALAPAVSKSRQPAHAPTLGGGWLPLLPGVSKPVLQDQLPPGPLVETFLVKVRDGQQWVVGTTGGGNLRILPRGALKGGRSNDFGNLVIGGDANAEISLEGSTATLADELPQLIWGLGDITIGRRAAGTLRVLDGGQVELRGTVLVGDEAPGTVVVSGASKTTPLKPSFVKFGIDLVIGKKNRGAVTVTRGADVTIVRNLLIGAVDRAGSGKLVVAGGAHVIVSNGAIVGHETGTSPSTIELCGTTAPGDEGTLEFGSGFLNEPGTLKVKQSGKVVGKGRIIGNPLIDGVISPGCSPGVLTIEGNYEQTEQGVLEIEVGGTQEGQFDVLRITGDAILAGRVDLTFIDGFVPERGDNFNFVVVDGTITGTLTGSSFVDAPGDPESGRPGAQAEVVWEVTTEGTCRMTVTNVTRVDANGVPLPAECGADFCGAGMVPMLGLTLIAMGAWRGLSAPRACLRAWRR